MFPTIPSQLPPPAIGSHCHSAQAEESVGCSKIWECIKRWLSQIKQYFHRKHTYTQVHPAPPEAQSKVERPKDTPPESSSSTAEPTTPPQPITRSITLQWGNPTSPPPDWGSSWKPTASQTVKTTAPSTTPVKPPAESLEGIRARLDLEPVREKEISVKDLCPKSISEEQLFRQIDRDIKGADFTIDDEKPENAEQLCTLLMQKTKKSREEILRFMQLCHQGIFAASAGKIRQELGMNDDDSEVSISLGPVKDSSPIFSITTNGEYIFLECSYSKSINGSERNNEPEICGTLQYSLRISFEKGKAFERWKVSSVTS